LYNPRHEPIDMNELYTDLKILGDLLQIKITGKRQVDTKKGLAKGIHKKTRKNNIRNTKNTRVSFKRGPKKRRFKKPFFLSSK